MVNGDAAVACLPPPDATERVPEMPEWEKFWPEGEREKVRKSVEEAIGITGTSEPQAQLQARLQTVMKDAAHPTDFVDRMRKEEWPEEPKIRCLLHYFHRLLQP